MKAYPGKKKDDIIYGYIALACLYGHDYAAAVDAYSNIDLLDSRQKVNYMKANYLRAHQLIEGGGWRDAVPLLKAASYCSASFPVTGSESPTSEAVSMTRQSMSTRPCTTIRLWKANPRGLSFLTTWPTATSRKMTMMERPSGSMSILPLPSLQRERMPQRGGRTVISSGRTILRR